MKCSDPSARVAVIVSTLIVLAVGGVAGWLGVRAEQSQQAHRQRESVMAAARQGAVNQTTTIGDDPPTSTASAVRVTLDKTAGR